jgi:hypothetical protein
MGKFHLVTTVEEVVAYILDTPITLPPKGEITNVGQM